MPFDNRPALNKCFGSAPPPPTRTGSLCRKHKLRTLLKIMHGDFDGDGDGEGDGDGDGDGDDDSNMGGVRREKKIREGYRRCTKGCGKIYKEGIIELHESQVRKGID